MATSATVTLLTRPGCHLCDAAREVVSAVSGGFPTVVVTELSIDDDPVLADRHAEEIPVVFIDDRVHNIWRIDPDRFRAALEEATR